MPARTRPLTVVVGADTKPFQKGMKEADSTLSKFTKSTTNHTRSLAKYSLAASGVGLSVGGMGAALKTAVSSASDVSESLSKNQVLFGKYTKGVEKFAATSATSFGISKRAALEYTGVFGNLFTALGVSGKESAKFSTSLTKLAADMASFNNTSIEDALESIRAGLVGETEPLRKFGVNLNDATLRQKAMALGLTNTTKNVLTPYQKAMASQALIVEQTKKAHGDFHRTQGGLANQTRILSARMGDLQATVGTALLPTITKGANSLNKFITEMQDGTGQGGRFVKKLDEIRGEVEPVARQFLSAGKAVAKFTGEHPELIKVAVGVAAVGTAIKAIRFAGAISGFSAFLSAGKTAMSGLKRIMAAGGTAAGEAAAARAAEGMADQLPSSVNARKSKFSAVGRTAGGFIGVAMGTAAVAVAGAALLKWLSQTNDQLEKKGGLAGLAGKISNIGESIARNAPGPVGDVSRAIIGNGSRRAGGGRIPGMPVAADTYPALLSPQEFVVTGDGERTLESMTFPGVLNWLEGAQAPHFQNGGRAPKRMATGGRVGAAVAAARAAGFKGTDLVNMIAIAGRESRYDPTAVNIGPRDHSIGLWQINQLAHKGKYGSDSQLKNPLVNAKAAWALFKAAGLSPWNHAGGPLGGTNVAAARKAVQGMGGAGGGGTAGTKAGGPRPSGDQIFAGFQAASQGESLRQFLAGALDYVGESNRIASTPLASSAGASTGGPPAVQAMLQRARKYAFGPYDYGGGHGGFGKPGAKGGFDCSGYVSAILGPGVLPSPMAVVQPMAGALQSGEGKYVTVGMRGSSGKSAHTMIKIGNSYYESGGGHGAAKVGGWSGSFQKYHPAGLRRGGRMARRMRGGGRGLHRYATGKRSGTVRSVSRGPSESTIRSLLGTIASGNPSSIKGALRKAQTYMAAHPSIGALRGWINAANRRIEARGVSAAGARGLQSFTALAQNELGRQLANPITAIDATEAGFDQGTTDLGNQLAASRATDAQTAGAQGALATSQLQTLYANRAGIATQLNRARRSGSKKTVQALEARLSQADSAILAKRAEVVGYQDAYTAATTGDTSVEDERNRLLQENTDALKAHADALTSVRDELKRQTDFAQSVQTTSASQLAKTLADVVSGQIAGGLTQRRFTAGVGTVASY